MQAQDSQAITCARALDNSLDSSSKDELQSKDTPGISSSGDRIDQDAVCEPLAFFPDLVSSGETARAPEQPADSTSSDDTASEAADHAELQEAALTEQASEAAAKLLEYQLWFPFVDEERPTAGGRVAFMLPTGALHAGLEAIALGSVSGKSTPVAMTLTPGRLRLTLKRSGRVVETNVPLADFANLPRNGLCISTRYSAIRRLMAIECEAGADNGNATFSVGCQGGEAGPRYLTYKHEGTVVDLEAELITAPAPLPGLEDRPLYPPATARALARALNHVSVLPKQTYYGPAVVGGGTAGAFSRDAVVEYQHTDIVDLRLAVDLAFISDLTSLLRRSKLGLRIAECETHTVMSDGVIRYSVPRAVERRPQYSAMKEEAFRGTPIVLDRTELRKAVARLDAATAFSGFPPTVRLVVEQEGGDRLLLLIVRKPTAGGQVQVAVVNNEFELGEHGRLPLRLLVKMVKSGAFDSVELRLTKFAGAIIQHGDCSTLTCIFPFHDAHDEV
jgi:hypothetical protein